MYSSWGKDECKAITYVKSVVCFTLREKVLAFPETNIYATRFSRFSLTEIQIFRERTWGHETLNFEIFSCVS